jgi:type IV pilus assembly protein PilC
MNESIEQPTSFAYQAQTVDGQAINGSIEAIDADHAQRVLTAMNLRVMQMQPQQRVARPKPLRGEDFQAFNQQLTQLTAAGLPVEHGLRLIARDMRSGRLAATIREVVAELERGTALGEAFEKFHTRFPPLYGKLVAAGVRANNLTGMLLNLGRHLDLVTRLRSMLWRAFAYPLMVLLALALVMLFLGAVVIPQFAVLFKDFGIQLPGITLFLLHSSRWLPWVAVAFFSLVVASPLIWRLLRLAKYDRAIVDYVVVPLPLIGPVMHRNLISRWCDAVRLGVEAAMDLPSAIELAGEAIGSPKLRADGETLIQALSAGQPLDQIARFRSLPATVAAVLSIGSEQRDLPAMLQTLSEMYQQQAEVRVGLVPGVLTPILIVLIAIIIGIVILGLFLPFISLLRSLTS